MTTAIYQELSPREKWQIGAYGATEAQVKSALLSYLDRRTQRQVVIDLMNSGWTDINFGQLEDARQVLNRAKLAIMEWFGGDDRDFFLTYAGQAMSALSDAQELIGMEDTRRAQMSIDTAIEFMKKQGGARGQ
jgi:hypothetical protein